MFKRFTDKARTAVIAGRAEAAERGDQIRPVYLLHALAEGDGVAARALASIGIDLDEAAARTAPGALLLSERPQLRPAGAGQASGRRPAGSDLTM